jgi:hypothetical protein
MPLGDWRVRSVHSEEAGRNVYQAACGGSNDATDWVDNFLERTADFPSDRRKALLDGALFEIFFDSHASLRPEIKGNLFDQVFGLYVSARAWPLVRRPFECYRRRWISGSTSSITIFSLMALPSALSRRCSSSVAVSF